jgi:hypothetical protein
MLPVCTSASLIHLLIAPQFQPHKTVYLTSWCGVYTEKLTVPKLVKKFLTYYGTRGGGGAQSIYRLGYGLDDLCSVSGRCNDGNFSLTTAFRQAPGPTQPLIQWVPGDLTPG